MEPIESEELKNMVKRNYGNGGNIERALETVVREFHNRLMVIFNKCMEEDDYHKGEEPILWIQYGIKNNWEDVNKGKWLCDIYSYVIGFEDYDYGGGRHYEWNSDTLEGLIEKVNKSIKKAEKEYGVV